MKPIYLFALALFSGFVACAQTQPKSQTPLPPTTPSTVEQEDQNSNPSSRSLEKLNEAARKNRPGEVEHELNQLFDWCKQKEWPSVEWWEDEKDDPTVPGMLLLLLVEHGKSDGQRALYLIQEQLTQSEKPNFEIIIKNMIQAEMCIYIISTAIKLVNQEMATTYNIDVEEAKYVSKYIALGQMHYRSLANGMLSWRNGRTLEEVSKLHELLGYRFPDGSLPDKPQDSTPQMEAMKKFAKDKFGAQSVRIWLKGGYGTADEDDTRLNIHVNEYGYITMVRWG